jgi:hypothetical protein
MLVLNCKYLIMILAFLPTGGPLHVKNSCSESGGDTRSRDLDSVPSLLSTSRPTVMAFNNRWDCYATTHFRIHMMLRNLNAARGLRGGRLRRAKKPRSSTEMDKPEEDGSNEDSALEQAALAMTDPFSPKVAGGLSAWGATKQRARRQVMVEEEPQEEGTPPFSPVPLLAATHTQHCNLPNGFPHGSASRA